MPEKETQRQVQYILCKNTWGQSIVAIKKHHVENTLLLCSQEPLQKKSPNLQPNLWRFMTCGLWASLNSSVTLTVLGHHFQGSVAPAMQLSAIPAWDSLLSLPLGQKHRSSSPFFPWKKNLFRQWNGESKWNGTVKWLFVCYQNLSKYHVGMEVLLGVRDTPPPPLPVLVSVLTLVPGIHQHSLEQVRKPIIPWIPKGFQLRVPYFDHWIWHSLTVSYI